MADLKNYFQQEIVALRGLGKDAAQKNPALVSFLATPKNDESVEKLMEGFAFLAGRLHQKLDDNFPEITHGLFEKVWPSYLRPFPAVSIIEYRLTDNTTGTTTIPKGTVVSSPPEAGQAYMFNTVYDTAICPLKLSSQEFHDDRKHPRLVLGFTVTSGSLPLLSLPYLRLFFSGQYADSCTLYHTITRLTDSIDVLVNDNDQKACLGSLSSADISRVGFADWLLPYSSSTPEGYRVIQEFFAFPEKFMFSDIHNLEPILKRSEESVDSFELHCNLSTLPENTDCITASSIRLFCTPVVNFFSSRIIGMKAESGESVPIRLEQKDQETCRIYSVDRVAGVGKKEKHETEYANALSERISIFGTEPTYTLDLRPGTEDGNEGLFIRIDAKNSGDRLLNLDVTCTNGRIPSQVSIESDGGGEGAVPYINIAPVSAYIPAPLQGEKLWSILSGMTSDTSTISSARTFLEVISQYHFRSEHDDRSQRYLKKIRAGLVSVSSKQSTRLDSKSIPCRGIETTFLFDRKHFNSEGEIFLLGTIFSQFLRIYTTPANFHRTITKITNGNEYPEPVFFGHSRMEEKFEEFQ